MAFLLRVTTVAIVVYLGLAFAPPVPALPCTDYAEQLHLTDTWGNGHSTYTSFVDQGFAYVTGSVNPYDPYTSTRIYDIRNPYDVLRVGSLSVPVPPGHGPQAYGSVAAGFDRACGLYDGAIWFADATDPAESIRFVTSLPVTGSGARTAMGDGYCFLATMDPDVYTLHVIDVRVLDEPAYVTSLELPGDVVRMVVSGDHLLVANDVAGLTIVDIGNPLAPTVISTTAVSHAAHHVAVTGDLALVVGDGHLSALDIADVTDPTPRGDVDVGGSSVAASGQYAFVGGVEIIDVSDPDAPMVIDRIGYPDSHLSHVGVWDGTLVAFGLQYSFGQPGGIGVAWNVSTLRQDAVVSSVAVAHGQSDLVVSGGHVFAVDWSGLAIIDVTDPLQPTPVTTGLEDLSLRDIDVVGDHAYVVSDFEGLIILDVSDPADPVSTAVQPIDYARAVAVHGGLAYVATGTGLNIVDVSDVFEPTIVGSASGGIGDGIVVDGQFAYVIDSSRGLQILDVSDPSAPVEISRTAVGYYPHHIAKAGGFVYVPSYGGVTTVDVSDPTSPIPGATTGAGGFTGDMDVAGSVLYVAATHGLVVMDITDPGIPMFIGGEIVAPRAVDSEADVLCIVGGNVLSVLKTQCQGATPVDPEPVVPGVTPISRDLLLTYPSPVSSRATIRFLGAVDAPWVTARVMDVRGRVVDEVRLFPDALGFSGSWDASRNASGVYFVEIQEGPGRVTQKLVRVE